MLDRSTIPPEDLLDRSNVTVEDLERSTIPPEDRGMLDRSNVTVEGLAAARAGSGRPASSI